MIPIPAWAVRPLIGAAVAVALFYGYVAWRDHQREIGADGERAAWEVKLEGQKREAAGLLSAATERARTAEKVASDARAVQNTKDVQNANLTAENSRLLLANRRLRDPNATPARCGGGGGNSESAPAAGTGDRDADGAEDAGLLSVQFSDLLRDRLREADEVNDAYASCRVALRAAIALGKQ